MKKLLVTMSRADTLYGTHPVRYAVLRGRQVLRLGGGAADSLANQPASSLRMSLDSPANVSERIRVRALGRRFVPVMVQRHLTDSGTFTDRFRSRSQVAWLRQGEAEVNVHAMLEDDAELAQTLVQGSTRPLTHLVTADAAVAALIGAVTPSATLVHWWHGTSLRSLGVRNGSIAWLRVQPVDAAPAQTSVMSWKPLLDSAGANAPAEFSGANCQVIRLGNGPWAATGEWSNEEARVLVQRLAGLFKGGESDQVLLQPELFGLAFATRHQNLIVNGYRQRVAAWYGALVTAGLASLAGVVLMALGVWWQAQADQRNEAVKLGLQTLAAQNKALVAQSPPTAAMAALKSAIWRETALGVNLRVDHFLNELLAQVPNDAQITQIKITRDSMGNQRLSLTNGQPTSKPNNQTALATAKRGPISAQAKGPGPDTVQPVSEVVKFTPGVPRRRMPTAGEPTFAVALTISLAGGYSDAKLKAENMAEQLSRMGRLSDTRLVFEDQGPAAPGARVQTVLTIASGAF